MKHVWVGSLALAVTLTAFGASAQVRSWDSLDWWAQSGAKADPVKDPDYSGYWWWPTDPASNTNDQELWGNRGVVYSMFSPAPPPPPAPPPAGSSDAGDATGPGI